MRRINSLVAAFAFVAISTAAFAGWQDQASRFDIGRMARFSQSRAKALAEAEQGAPQADLAVIHSVVDAQPVSGPPSAFTGLWRCRTMLLGGMTPDRIYTWFRCRISDRSGHLFFEKISGSQRMAGFLYPEGPGFVYLGASYVAGSPAPAYSGNAATAGAPATPDDQIGVLSLLADGRARIELPAPIQEADFIVIELKR